MHTLDTKKVAGLKRKYSLLVGHALSSHTNNAHVRTFEFQSAGGSVSNHTGTVNSIDPILVLFADPDAGDLQFCGTGERGRRRVHGPRTRVVWELNHALSAFEPFNHNLHRLLRLRDGTCVVRTKCMACND